MLIHCVSDGVHFNDALSDGQRSDLVGHLKGCDGVEDARFTPGRNHLMLVDYDRDQLHAQDVLGYVRETHTAAELVGP